MKKALWLAASLLAVAALIICGCAQQPAAHPKGMGDVRWLTDAEKEKVIEIALNTPEALNCLEEYTQYTTGLGWVTIVWDNEGNMSEWRSFDYDIVETGLPRGIVDITPEGSPEKIVAVGVPDEAAVYSEVTIHFGEPSPQWVLQVAVDLETESAVYILSSPFRTGPTPPEDTN